MGIKFASDFSHEELVTDKIVLLYWNVFIGCLKSYLKHFKKKEECKHFALNERSMEKCIHFL